MDVLDLVREKGIEMECVCGVSDRTIAISNLKMLRPMVKAYGYSANEQYRGSGFQPYGKQKNH